MLGGGEHCEGCDDGTVITNSQSGANVGFGCDNCTWRVFEEWWQGDMPEWEGLEIRRLRESEGQWR